MVFGTTSNSDHQFSLSSMEKSPSVWQNRTKVTFDHFLHEFHGMKDKEMKVSQNPYLVLETFLQLVFFFISILVFIYMILFNIFIYFKSTYHLFKEFGLSLLRHIPSILQMQRHLMKMYGKKITREEAEEKTLQNCVEDFANGNFVNLSYAMFSVSVSA